MKTFNTAMAMICAILISATVIAQTDSDVTEYRFDDDIVEGDLLQPDGATIPVRKLDDTPSLVKVRGHFVPEMLKSVENI